MTRSSTDQAVLTREQVRRLDALAATELGIPTLLLMENAAIGLARIACEMVPGGAAPSTILILAGPGNNGGDGFALARHLAAMGHAPIIACAAPAPRYTGDALTNLTIIQRMKLPVVHLPPTNPIPLLESFIAANPPAPSLIVDGLLGTGSTSAPKDPIATLIEWINAQRAPVLAIDIPTGLDADTGNPVGSPELVVRATRTLTLGALKPGLVAPHAAKYVGRVAVCDLGLPGWVVERVKGMLGDGHPVHT